MNKPLAMGLCSTLSVCRWHCAVKSGMQPLLENACMDCFLAAYRPGMRHLLTAVPIYYNILRRIDAVGGQNEDFSN